MSEIDIILASGSYKRKEILTKAGIVFRVVVPEIDERLFDALPVKERVQKIAREKARKVAGDFPKAVVIAADTMDESERKIVNHKPKDLAEGLKMAMAYSGSGSTCYTGICLIHPKFGEVVEVSETKIKMQTFSKEEVMKLVDDKFLLRAGALGISEETAGFTLVESLAGSFTGPFGLPMELVRKYLKKWGVI